ncbi:N-acetylmuramoyl-L-alanine amidase [Hydrogenispora ethanolica]|uniref:N-acetylmuramoyl-L-alanine amidase n=1 Tax=Hydrogenispora ethanolica TaxID=1082276 RepID=A0A4R1SDB8_HYDET|nr:N-acetylmuramoyl-L-alanine amidase [Hydrogenispora ethanolica]TCL77030.1 N-acetylmuramoyl-L-alanine amidase [Hydrogenispora ethanolica]
MKIILVSLFLALLTMGAVLADSGALLSSPAPPAAVAEGTSPGERMPLPAQPIRIVAPAENAQLPALAATFVCGAVPPGGQLRINGAAVEVHPEGGFLAMVPLAPGPNLIRAELEYGGAHYELTRTIRVAEPARPAPVHPLTVEYVTPGQDQELLPGDAVTVTAKGSPGMKAYFTVSRVRKRWPMIESAETPGIYQGVYRVGAKDRLKQSRIKVTLADDRHKRRSAEAKGALSLFPGDLPVLAETVSPDAVLRAGPAVSAYDRAGYLMFPPPGTLLQLTGRNGDEYRVRLNRTRNVWVSAGQIKLLPSGTPPARVVAGSVAISAVDGRSARIRLPLGRKIPFLVAPDPGGRYLDLSLFGATSNTDLIAYAATGPIRRVQWFQDDEETYRLRIATVPRSWWGYDVRYEGNALVVELRLPPPLPAGASPLAGLAVAVDAGHSPDTGAVGVTGYLEKDANLAIALQLQKQLEAEGAKVIMIRRGDEGVPLNERPRIAWQKQADILVSIHNNSLGYGGNPLLKHGYGVYYFTPMSQALAGEIHRSYGETFGPGAAFGLRDDGLYYDNLAVTRGPQMPAVLTESAYLIHPVEEAYLRNDAFRAACAAAIRRGIERYAGRMRPVMAPAE